MKDALTQLIKQVETQPPVEFNLLLEASQIAAWEEPGISVKGNMAKISVVSPPIVYPALTAMGESAKIRQMTEVLAGLLPDRQLVSCLIITIDAERCPTVVKQKMVREARSHRYLRYALYDNLEVAISVHQEVELALGQPASGVWDHMHLFSYLSQTDIALVQGVVNR